MHALPPNAPTNLYEAFAYIGSVRQPTIDDLKLMLLLEAAGKAMYQDLAADAADPDTGSLLIECGDEEYLHAQRLAQVLTLLTNEPHSVPASEENPYLVAWQKAALSAGLVDNLAAAEAGGEALYEGWAASCPNPDAAGLLRQNGYEETAHAERLRLIGQRLAR
jgi:rubrerythrin